MTWRWPGGILLAGVALWCLWLSMASPWIAADLALRQALVKVSDARAPPPPSTAWQATRLPLSGAPPRVTWFRVRFDITREPDTFWSVLLPYLYGGGQVWLDGVLLGDVPISTAQLQVQWERPFLFAIAPHLLRAGAHELAVRASPGPGDTSLNFPAPSVGPAAVLRAQYDRRAFWVRTMPALTVAGCLVVALLVLLIWWRLPEEVLYGWFGVATAMWGIRTLTFLLETVPADRWHAWRVVYLASTGGFVIVLALFAGRLAGLRHRWVQRGLLAYWALGPAWLLLQGVDGDARINQLWSAGLIPIALGLVIVACVPAWRERSLTSLLLPAALAVATLAGVHDYLIVWEPAPLERIAPAWAGQRYFLMHYGADLVLVAMGVLLSARFVRSVEALRELNETLEVRIADRENALAANFARVADLERQNAASVERNRIMREIHDGLGSRLFTSLSRVERGALDAAQMAATLRACIAEMRLALEALAPNEHDLLNAFADFMFRWQAELQAAAVHCAWTVDVPGDTLDMAPHTTLQVLRVAQEALTNVAKHAGAKHVDVLLSAREGVVLLRITDDGAGIALVATRGGRGLRNMHARAQQLGATLAVAAGPDGGTVVTLRMPC